MHQDPIMRIIDKQYIYLPPPKLLVTLSAESELKVWDCLFDEESDKLGGDGLTLPGEGFFKWDMHYTVLTLHVLT